MKPEYPLIDKAVKVCGSRYQLAKRLNVSESYLSNVYNRKRPLSPEMAAFIADVAGVDPRDAAAVTMIENRKDPAEREALKRIFFRTGGAAMLAFSIIVGLVLCFQPTDAAASITRLSDLSIHCGGLPRRWLKRLEGFVKRFSLRFATP